MVQHLATSLDWAAPVVPGQSMMGLSLGLSYAEVLAALYAHRVDDVASTCIRFANSPLLIVDAPDHDGIILRGSDVRVVNYPWQNVLATLAFRDQCLTNILMRNCLQHEELHYLGRLHGDVGMGSRVADLLKYGVFEYDEAEEWFYPVSGPIGLLVAGGEACSLEEAPDQTICTLHILSPADLHP